MSASVSRAGGVPRVVSRRLARRAIPLALAARRHPRAPRALLLATFFAAAPGGGHAGTTPVRTTMAPPGEERHSHLPEVTGIEYAPTPSGAIHLPPPDTHGHGHAPLERVISSRRSCRDFAPPPTGLLHLYEIAQMCWAAQGVTAPEEPPDEFGHAGASRRAAPSGGRLYPLTLYAVVSRAVGGVPPGAYEYLPLAHALRPVPAPDQCAADGTCEADAAARAHARLCDATVPQVATALRQDWIADAAVVFVVSGDVGATAKHGGLYARFAEHLVELEAGMVAAQLGLQATALGLGATPVGAFEKKAVRSVVGSERVGEAPAIMVAVGVPKGSYREHHGGVRPERGQEL